MYMVHINSCMYTQRISYRVTIASVVNVRMCTHGYGDESYRV